MNEKVSIRPGPGLLTILRHLPYHSWYAMAEFVDNSITSMLANRDKLLELDGKSYTLKVNINISDQDPPRITIRDNAAGIFSSEYDRAFRPAVIPEDTTRLSEFGMGMKTAAAWFAPVWCVRTSALGEDVERTVKFDIAQIQKDSLEELSVETRPVNREDHYTEVTLEEPFQRIRGPALGKLKNHLKDIYREFTRSGDLSLYVNGELLTYEAPEILEYPLYNDKTGKKRLWRKEIKFDFGMGQSVRGFVAIRKTGSTSQAGFALFRRGRVIQGSADEGYRPGKIFGSPNSYAYQRVFGELHIEGFEVSHTKDGFKWDDSEEEVFLDELKRHINSDELPILKQAEEYRPEQKNPKARLWANQALGSTAPHIQNSLPRTVEAILESETSDTPRTPGKSGKGALAWQTFQFHSHDMDWSIVVELVADSGMSDWIEVSDDFSPKENLNKINVRMNLEHPFMLRFAARHREEVEGLLRVAAGVSMSGVLAHRGGIKRSGTFVRNLNRVLRDCLSEA